MFTSIIGDNTAMLGNVVPAYDIDMPLHPNYAGLVILDDNLFYDQFWGFDSLGNMTIFDPQVIPNPFIETAGLNNE